MEETAARINDMLIRSKAELGIPESQPYDIVVSISHLQFKSYLAVHRHHHHYHHDYVGS